jgi:hypothetical protein
MKVRGKNQKWSGSLMKMNEHGIGSIIVGFDDNPDGSYNGMDDMPIDKCELQLPDGTWKDLRQAFKDRDILTDNYNIHVYYNNHKCHSCHEDITGEAITSTCHDFCSISCRDKFFATII